MTGCVALILHAHLPFVRHPEAGGRLEERWLFEAVTESYLPLLEMLERLEAEGIRFRLTLSLSPTLLAMLDDPLLRRRCRRYLEAGLDLAEREVQATRGRADHAVAHFYHQRLRTLLRLYAHHYRQDLPGAFARLARAGYLELITCAATHGFLPYLLHPEAAAAAQIRVAVAQFTQRFGHPPRGLWLPECGWCPEADGLLRQAGVGYTVVEGHGLTHARPAAPRATYAHGWSPAGVALFGRDGLSSKQVWSAHEGYPGDSAYREFHRDIGFEREPAHLGALAAPGGRPAYTGLKYHRVTGPTDFKDLYDRWAAEQTAIRHAAHFLQERVRQLAAIAGVLPGGPPPVIVAPYDAELFGHWWFEGPFFLEQLARQAAAHPTLRFVTLGEYLDLDPPGQGALEPAFSSWGYEGYGDFWCDGSNQWVYRHLHRAGKQMARLVQDYGSRAPGRADAPHGEADGGEANSSSQAAGAGALAARALSQAGRELLLAQASDWPFLMRTGTAGDYARERFATHLHRFWRITEGLQHGTGPDAVWLSRVEACDNLFPNLDYRVFSPG